MDFFVSTDHQLFDLINGHWHSDLLDSVMPVIRNANTWIPLYLFIFLFVLINHKNNAWWWILFAIAVPALGDLISSGIIKNLVYRVRPCNNPDIIEHVRFLLSYRPQSSSFTSSHATNHFAMATFFFITLKPKMKTYAWLFFLWAALIAYAQVYVGVHYPLDVMAGALLGLLLGYFVSSRFNHYFGLS